MASSHQNAASASAAPSLVLPDSLSPDSIDTLTDLASILARVQYTDKTVTNGINDVTTGATPTALTSPAIVDAISIKDFSNATDQLKHKFQRARAQVQLLPDMQRNLEQQEVDIKTAEAKLAKQKDVLAQLREIGMLREDTTQTDG